MRGARGRAGIVVGLVAAVAAIATVDYATGPLLSLSIFYFLPVAAGTALLGRRIGLMLALLAGWTSFLSDVVLLSHDPHRGTALWNTLLMVATLVVLVGLLGRLRDRTLEAVASSERSRGFLAFAAHQLRTPIAGIRSGADALAVAGPDDPEAGDLVAGLAHDADRAARLISSLLRVARLDEHETLPLDTADLAGIAEEEVRRAADVYGRALAWDFVASSDGPTDAVCNRDALREAIANLLDNASRHARQRVTVSVQGGHRVVAVVVADDGPGLAGDAAEAAFNRFVSLDGCGGSGLGLPIARGVCEAHGGTLDYDGRAFIIRIPRGERDSRLRERRPGSAADRLQPGFMPRAPVPDA